MPNATVTAPSCTCATNEKLKGTNLGSMLECVNSCVDDYIKALGGGKLASTRVRKNMLTIKELVNNIRKEMLDSRQK